MEKGIQTLKIATDFPRDKLSNMSAVVKPLFLPLARAFPSVVSRRMRII